MDTYNPVMVEKIDPPARPAPQELIDALAESEADVAAGRTVPWLEVRARLLAELEEIEAELASRRA